IVPAHRTPVVRGNRDDRGEGRRGWRHFRFSSRRGITVVVVTDRALIKDQDLAEFAGDLLALVSAGFDRVVLNFAAVERLSSWAVGAVADAARACAAARGGALRVCGLRAQVASVVALTSLDREVRVFPDEP